MAEKAETSKILDEISKGTNPKSGGASSRSQKNARRRFLIVLILFLPVIAAVAYVGWSQLNMQSELLALRQRNESMSVTIDSYESQLSALNQQIANIPEQVPVDNSATDALAVRLTNEINSLNQQLADLAARQVETSAPQNSQWKIQEANYLVQLANRKLQLESDVDSAIQLLQSADSALLDSGSNAVLRARQGIADDLAMLRDLELLDREGIYIQLDNVKSQISSIDLVTSMRESLQNRIDESPDQQVESAATGFIDSSFEFLSSVFVWRRWEDSPEAMLAPGQESFILQRVQLMMDQAKVALLERNNAMYQRSLSEAVNWVRQFAMTDSTAGQAVLVDLASLQAINVDPSLPELNQSLGAVEQLAASVQ